MKISRRAFISSLSAIGTYVALSPLSAIAIESNRYVNNRLRFAIDIPPEWNIISLTDMTRVREASERNARDPELQKVLHEFNGMPILVLSKFPMGTDGVCPNIQIYADPIESSSNEAFYGAIENGREYMKTLYDNLNCEPLRTVTIGNSRGIGGICSYTYESAGEQRRIGAATYNFLTPYSELTFSFVDLYSRFPATHPEFNNAFKSIRFL